MPTSLSRAVALDSATFRSLSISIMRFARSVSRVFILSRRILSVCMSSPFMPLIRSTMFLMFAAGSGFVSVCNAALNLALQLGHSNIPVSLGCSPFRSGLGDGMGQVLMGVGTSVPHFGQLVNF